MKRLIIVAIIMALMSTGCAWIIGKAVDRHSATDTEMLKAADLAWVNKDFHAGLYRALIERHTVSREAIQAVNALNAQADPQSDQYKKGLYLGTLVDADYFLARSVKTNITPDVLGLAAKIGVAP